MNNWGSLYELAARTLQGQDVILRQYEGKVVVVVNTASQCGFTPQYAGLEALYCKFKARGLVVLGFPCNQFGNQEPGDADAIKGQCLVNYGVTFPMFEKVEVNGEGAHPVFRWLTAHLPGWLGRKVRWNFTKFLIGRDGQPLRRFAPATAPAKMEAEILKALGE